MTLDPRIAADLAALAWQVEMGADEAIGDAPVSRFATHGPSPRKGVRVPAVQPSSAPKGAGAEEIAAACTNLAELRAAMAAFEGCALKRGARTLVFAEGNPAARVMIVGEAPGAEEDREGRPFVGRPGLLLDRMLAAISLSRRAEDPKHAVYLTPLLPWRPPQDRAPSAGEIVMLLPFLHRHIELADPAVLVVMGSAAARALLGTTAGIVRLRGTWTEWRGRPVLPMLHPDALLRSGELKRAAWADLLALSVRLDAGATHD